MEERRIWSSGTASYTFTSSTSVNWTDPPDMGTVAWVNQPPPTPDPSGPAEVGYRCIP